MKIKQEILAILSRVTVKDNSIVLTCGQLDRKTYIELDKILQCMGGKWNKKLKSHLFDEDPTEKLESVLLTGELEPPKKYGYFPTPRQIVERLIDLAGIEPGMKVLEPSAGKGAIAEEVAAITGREAIDCIELLPDNIEALKKKGYSPRCCDFLTVEPNPIYDVVVMNPPFEKQADIDHVIHAFKFVSPGGRLVSVMSSGVTFRENKKTVEFRKILETGYYENNPENSFRESGTGVNTIIISLEKSL